MMLTCWRICENCFKWSYLLNKWDTLAWRILKEFLPMLTYCTNKQWCCWMKEWFSL